MSFNSPSVESDLARRAIRGQAANISGSASFTSKPPTNPLVAAKINVATIGTHVIIPGVSGQRIEVYLVHWFSEVQQNLSFLNGTLPFSGGSYTAWPAQQGTMWPNVGSPYWECDAGNSLSVVLSAAGQLSGFLHYRMVA